MNHYQDYEDYSDELTQPNGCISALKILSSNHNIVISPSDKGGGFFYNGFYGL